MWDANVFMYILIQNCDVVAAFFAAFCQLVMACGKRYDTVNDLSSFLGWETLHAIDMYDIVVVEYQRHRYMEYCRCRL